nr:hypothetical protein [uncultured Actinoplanes sp.]
MIDVVSVLVGGTLWPPAEVVTFLLLAGYAVGGLTGSAGRWVVAVSLAPLLAEALLTVPHVDHSRAGGLHFLSPSRPRPEPDYLLQALDTGFAVAGPPLLFAATLVVLHRGKARRAWLAIVAWAAIVAYAISRIASVQAPSAPFRVGPGLGARIAAALVPVLLAAAALMLASVARRRSAVAGAVLLAASAIPMIETYVTATRVVTYRSGQFATGAVDFRALTLGLQFVAYFLLIAATTKELRSRAG